jgi:maleate isomerase
MRIGLILTYDNAIDAELWRWCPPGVSLHIARTGYPELDPDVRSLDDQVADPDQIAFATRSLVAIAPVVIGFACTTGSFHHGVDGERALVDAMLEAGAARAFTTSGALLEAIRAIGARRIAVATPYDEASARELAAFLGDSGLETVGVAYRDTDEGDDLTDIPDSELERLVEIAMNPDAEAIFLSCTAVPTIDLVPRLEKRYGIPVLTSTQVTMWAALHLAGAARAIVDQELFRVTPSTDFAAARPGTEPPRRARVVG